jgi:RNA polymerase sigma-70 factor (sigma-E family)
MERSTMMAGALDASDEAGAASAEPIDGKLERLYRQEAPTARRLAYFLTGNTELAEDLVQEAFVRVAGRFTHLREFDRFGGYLRRTVVNLWTSQLRRRRLERAWLARQRKQEPVEDPTDPSDRDEMWRALQRLSERQRAAIVLRFYEDLSEEEAANILGCSKGALKQLVVRGMASLREHMGSDPR